MGVLPMLLMGVMGHLVIANGSRLLAQMTLISNISSSIKKGSLDSPKLPFDRFI
jgi:hypothetical protein